jgi:TrpR-related protein YerC/YecD
MSENLFKTRAMRELAEAILVLEDVGECKKFFRDLCTLSELQAMAERFQVAKRVLAGETYREISRRTGSSTATVTRVAHWLHHGTGGYRLVLERMQR